MIAYSELLKDPRWQRRRKQILKRDNYTCQECGATNVTLQVHHTMYFHAQEESGFGHKFLPPWQHPDRVLKTLCVPCHEKYKKPNKPKETALQKWKKANRYI